jgi:hypothetical protein
MASPRGQYISLEAQQLMQRPLMPHPNAGKTTLPRRSAELFIATAPNKYFKSFRNLMGGLQNEVPPDFE